MKPLQGVHWPIGHFKFRSLPPSPRARRVLRYVNGELKNLLQCQEIPNLVTDALGPYGIQTAFIGRYLSHGDQKNSDESSPILIASNTDPQSQKFYFAQSWQLIDLRIQLGNVIARPFLWHEISHIGSQQLIYKKAAEFGMNTGICLPGNARGRTGGIVLSAQKLQIPMNYWKYAPSSASRFLIEPLPSLTICLSMSRIFPSESAKSFCASRGG